MAYIANKPVRFDRDYAIGEVIPDEVIDPKMEKRLINWGKISKIAISAVLHPDEDPDIDKFPGNDTNPNSKKEDDEPENDGDEKEPKDDESENDGGVNDNITPKNGNGEINPGGEDAKPPEETNVSDANGEGEANVTTKTNPEDAETGGAEQEAAEEKKDLPNTICPVCDKVCGSASGLTSHMKAKHPERI